MVGPSRHLNGFRPFFETLNDRFRIKLGSDRLETLPKRVSDDSRRFIFRHFFFRNFERPFTPRGCLRSASDFGKTRFRRFPTFHFSTPKIFFRQNFRTKNFSFLLIRLGFGRSTEKRTSKSAYASNFAPDRLILRSVRPNMTFFRPKTDCNFGENLGLR